MELEVFSFFLSIIAIVISFLGLYYKHLKRGELLFGIPRIYYLYKQDNKFVIAFPLTISNSGAYSHTVDYLFGMLKSDEQEEIRFHMSKDLTGHPPDSPKAPDLICFEIAAYSNVVKLVSFEAEKSFIEEGNYEFELAGHIDGHYLALRNLMSFGVQIDQDTRGGLIKNKYNVTHQYTIEEQKKLSDKQKIVYYIIHWFLKFLTWITFFAIVLFFFFLIDDVLERELLGYGIFLIILFFFLVIGKEHFEDTKFAIVQNILKKNR